MRPDIDAVTALVDRVAVQVVLPRFRELTAADVREKAPGDLVTIVDTEAEAALTAGLEEILPGVPVVAEERTAAEPERLALVDAPQAFVVDPLDGTSAFVEGSPDHAVMVAYLEHGEVLAGWICSPAHRRMLVAERGGGAWCDGTRLSRPAPGPLDQVRGTVTTGLMPPEVHDRIGRRVDDGVLGPGLVRRARSWSGAEYSRLALGEQDALVYWRTWPWDHAPGAVIIRELGGVSRRFDGSDYRPGEVGEGVLVAADEGTFERLHAALGLKDQA